MRLSIAIDGFLLAKTVAGCSPNTIRNYRHTLSRFQSYLSPADPDLDELTADTIRAFLQQLMRTQVAPGGFAQQALRLLSAKSLHNIYTCLCSLWTWAVSEGHARDHVVHHVTPPRPNPPAIEPFTEDQVKALMAATRYSRAWATSPETQTELPKTQQLRTRAILLFLLDTGVRASELCDLTIGDLDLVSGTARVRGKGRLNAGVGKLRIVRLGKRTRHALWLYLADRNALSQSDEPAFTNRAGEPYNRILLRTHLHRLGLRADIARCYPHRFRHTFALNYLRNGGDLFTLQQLLGHSSLEMVRRYVALAQADSEAAHRRASPVDHWRL